MKKEKIDAFRLTVHPFDVSSEDIKEMPQNFVRAAFDDGITQGFEFTKELVKEYFGLEKFEQFINHFKK